MSDLVLILLIARFVFNSFLLQLFYVRFNLYFFIAIFFVFHPFLLENFLCKEKKIKKLQKNKDKNKKNSINRSSVE
jgi:hypothetical protein